MPGRYERVCVGWHCAKVKGHKELNIERSRVKTFIYDFPKLHHSSTNSFGANVHLRKQKLKTVKVIERSRDVTPRSKVEKSKWRPRSPCAPNMVQFQPLFPELRHFEKNGTRHFFQIGRHLESASWTKLVFELVQALSERKPTCKFWSNSGYVSSVIVLTAQVGTFVPGKRSKVKWSYKQKHTFVQKFLPGHFKFGNSLSNSGPVIPKRRQEMTDRERERERERE